MKGISLIPLVGLLLAVMGSSCEKDKVQPMPKDLNVTVSFSGTIQPMMLMNCATSGCHDATTAADGRNLSHHAGITLNANDALAAMKHEGGFQPMPMDMPKLADSLIQQFEAWISQGKLNN